MLPEPLVLGELGLGAVVLLPELPLVLGELVLGEVLLPEVPPPAAAPLDLDLSKYASHSCFEICPSLSLSTDEKLGACSLAPVAPAALLPLALGVELLPDALGAELLPEEAPEPDALGVELLPLALGVELLPLALGVELLPLALGVELLALGVELLPDDGLELCATTTLESAKSAAAVAALMSFRFIWSCSLLGFG